MAIPKKKKPLLVSTARVARGVTVGSGTKKKRPTKKRAPSRDLIATVERRGRTAVQKNVAQARALVAQIVKRMARIEADFHAIGVALRRLAEPKLYGALGYDSLEALLKGEKLMSKTVAYKLMAVAEAYPAPTARKLGMDKAYSLLRYTEATPAPDLARALAESNPRIGEQRLSSMTVRDLVDATRRVKAASGSGRKKSDAEREARRVASELQRDLRSRGAPTAKVRAQRFDGEWRVVLELAVAEVEVVR